MRKTAIAIAIAAAFGHDAFLDRMTRHEASQWLAPMRRALAEIKTGEVDSIRGYAVTRLHDQDDYARLDFCINGFIALLARLNIGLDLGPAERLSKRLAAGTPLTVAEVDAALAILNQAESKLVGLPIRVAKDAVTVEQISIELEAMGLKEAA